MWRGIWREDLEKKGEGTKDKEGLLKGIVKAKMIFCRQIDLKLLSRVV